MVGGDVIEGDPGVASFCLAFCCHITDKNVRLSNLAEKYISCFKPQAFHCLLIHDSVGVASADKLVYLLVCLVNVMTIAKRGMITRFLSSLTALFSIPSPSWSVSVAIPVLNVVSSSETLGCEDEDATLEFGSEFAAAAFELDICGLFGLTLTVTRAQSCLVPPSFRNTSGTGHPSTTCTSSPTLVSLPSDQIPSVPIPILRPFLKTKSLRVSVEFQNIFVICW